MDDSFASRIFAKIGIAILVLALADLLYLNYWVLHQKPETDSQRGEITVAASPEPTASPQESPSPASSTSKTIVEKETVVEKETQTIIQTAQKEIFIPIGSGSTKNKDYTDLSGLEVTIDTGKYGAIESVVFESSIWVQDGNGKMYAQLYNETDSHPVWNSELSTSSASGVLTTSPKITLDSGSKTYRVQAKTNLVEYAAHVENARVKITLK